MLLWVKGFGFALTAALIVGFSPSAHGSARADAAAVAEPAENCRTIPTSATTRTTAGAFSSNVATACNYDPATNQATCTSRYSDSYGTTSTSVAVTSYGSLDNLLGEVLVVPPLRRSTGTTTTATRSGGSGTSTLTNTYDGQHRLIREVGTSSGQTYTTTFTAWDKAGRPTAGTSVLAGGMTNRLELVHNDATRTMQITTFADGQQISTRVVFDADGNQASASTTGPGGASTSVTTTTGTTKVCR